MAAGFGGDVMNDVMFGWNQDSQKEWLKSMETPPCTPPPGQVSLLDDDEPLDLDDEGLVNLNQNDGLGFEDIVNVLSRASTPTFGSIPPTPLPTPFESGANTPCSSRSGSPQMFLNILESDDLLTEFFDEKERQAKKHKGSIDFEQELLFNSLAAIAEESTAEPHSTSGNTTPLTSGPASAATSPSNRPPPSSSSTSMRRSSAGGGTSSRRRKSSTKAGRGKAKRGSKSGPSEQAKRQIHNMSERQRRLALKQSFEVLRLLVPTLIHEEKAHTGRILQEAVQYIKQLQQEDAHLMVELSHLRDQHHHLQLQLGQP